MCHMSTFAEILGKIDKSCNLKEALRPIKLLVREKNDEPFHWMSWLWRLLQHGRRIDFCDVLVPLEELLAVSGSDGEQALADFEELRSGFFRSVAYEDVCQGLEALLKMYRTVRNQYARDMLALHGRYGCLLDWRWNSS